MIRQATFSRKTNETDISVELELAAVGESIITSGVPFFDHMLAAFAKHGKFCIKLKCVGDIQVDAHHSVEDIGLCLGAAIKDALGDKAGVSRFGHAVVPMDDALVLAAVDLSNRPFFAYKGTELRGYIGEYSEELTIEFLQALANSCSMNLHVHVLDGRNRHHIHEAIFKALGLAMYKAVLIDPLAAGALPTTKGVL